MTLTIQGFWNGLGVPVSFKRWARFGGFGYFPPHYALHGLQRDNRGAAVCAALLIRGSECMHIPWHVGDNDDEGCNKTQVPFFER